MCGLLQLVQRGEDRAGPQPAQAPPRCTKCNSPPINGQCMMYRSPLLCGFNVPIKGLTDLLALIVRIYVPSKGRTFSRRPLRYVDNVCSSECAGWPVCGRQPDIYDA